MHPLEILLDKQHPWWLGLHQRTVLQACCNCTSHRYTTDTVKLQTHATCSAFLVYKCVLGLSIYGPGSGLTEKRQQNKCFILQILEALKDTDSQQKGTLGGIGFHSRLLLLLSVDR